MPESKDRRLKALTFVAPSGTGKTTLLEGVIERLVASGLTLAVMKASHHDHELDVEGKDSWRFQRAGASVVGLCGPGQTTLFVDSGRDRWPSLADCAEWFARAPFAEFDLLLCEGFSTDTSVDKIRVVRGDWPDSEERHSDLVAVAWDRASTEDGAGPSLGDEVAILNLDAESVATWIRADWMER